MMFEKTPKNCILLQKALSPYGLERSWEKFHFFAKSLVDLTEYPPTLGYTACSIGT